LAVPDRAPRAGSRFPASYRAAAAAREPDAATPRIRYSEAATSSSPAPTADSAPSAQSRRQRNNRLGAMPCRRATSDTDMLGVLCDTAVCEAEYQPIGSRLLALTGDRDLLLKLIRPPSTP
jgi:hypothetical protein